MDWIELKKDLKIKYPFGLSQKDIEKVFSYSVSYLANMRCRKMGPSFIKVNRKVFYPVDPLIDWLKQISREYKCNT